MGWAACALLIAAGCAEVGPQTGAKREASDDAIPASLRAAWIRRVQNDAGGVYAIRRASAVRFEARHPRQDLRASFGRDGVVLTDREGNAPMRITLARVNGRSLSAGRVSHQGNRVVVARQGIEEWYVHGPLGLEQGFTIPAPLESDRASDGRVRLEMDIAGDYSASMRGDAIVWRSAGRVIETNELYAFDAEGKQLSASMYASPGLLRIEVDAADARYPIEIDPIWLEQQKLVASSAAALGWFGYSVSMWGNTAVIGMPRDGDVGRDSGSAYVFVRSATSWDVQQELLPLDGEAGDQFGSSVSIAGDTIVVGASLDDESGTDSGSAYVFTRSGSVWTEQQKLIPSDGGTDDQFGHAVSISGDTVVVGARYDTDNGLFSGSAYTFSYDGFAWTEEQKLLPPDGVSGDQFGSAVSVSLDTAVIGAFQDDDNGTDSGSAYVFFRNTGVWSLEQKLLASDGVTVDRFGFSVIVDGDAAVIGAPLDDDNGSGSGSAYVFARSGGAWSEQQKLVASDGAPDDQFGHSVGLWGSSAVVGARLEDEAASNGGAVYVFTQSGGVWSEEQKVIASNGSPSRAFGTSVSISGDALISGAPFGTSPGVAYVYERSVGVWGAEAELNPGGGGPSDEFFGASVSVWGDTAVIGAPNYDDGPRSDSGAAYVFVRSGTVWSEQQELLASDRAAGDQFGSSVSIAGDTIVVGAMWDDDNGFFSGSAYVFVRSGSVWTQQQKLIASDGAGGDRFGSAVSLDADTAVIGALLHDGSASSSGAAYVFVRSGVVWAEQQKLLASDGAADDQFGTSVDISSDTVVVGAVLDDDGGSGSGSAYVFTRSGAVWTEQQKLVPLDTAPDDRFGTSVSVSGDTAAIGARWDDDNGANAGSTYVFARNGGVWAEEQELWTSDGGANQWFGSSVSIDGDAVLIGTWNDSDLGAQSGSAYVFTRSGSVWTEQDKLLAADGGAGDRFGWSVSLSGDTVLVGARDDGDRGPSAGAAYAFILMLENGDACSFDSECVSGFCDPVDLVCACDETTDCLPSELCDTSETPNACEPANRCGNGAVETGEACDDGGTLSGDGCSASCFTDNLPSGSDCTNGGNAACASGVCDTTETPDTCEPANACGNGVVEAGEACDDGNTTGGDGCSVACFIDNQPNGSDCTAGGDASCSSGVCDATETPPTCEPGSACGNGTVEAGELCDDGGTLSGDGCSASCFLESLPNGSDCAVGGNAACDSGICDSTETPPTCEPADTCGNAVLEAAEACDDGNFISGDGCSATCFVDGLPSGSDCTTNGAASCASGVCDGTETPPTCEPVGVCGNGVLDTNEACDDGSTVPGDGCSESCLVERQPDGSDCTVGGNEACLSDICDTTESPPTCEPAGQCGNGVIEGSEVCDDGNATAGDDCDPGCMLELGAGPCVDGVQCRSGLCNTLAASPVCALPNVCGNGVRDLDEACDDGNQGSGDWCTASCGLKNDWRGGGGCSVGTVSEGGGNGWLAGLLIGMLFGGRRRRRNLSA